MSGSPKEPWLSVVMPTFNGERFLDAALRSICDQGPRMLEDVEILAMDDGSTDGTLEILRRYESEFPLQVVTRGEGGNWAENTNRGFARAKGRYLCTLHQDDVWDSSRLSTLRSMIDAAPDIGLFLHPCHFIDPAGRRAGTWRCPLPDDRARVPAALVLERLLIQNFIAMPAPLFKRELAERVGGLDGSFWYTADWDLWLKLAEQCDDVGYCSTPLASYRLHPDALTNRRSVDGEAFRDELLRALEPHLARWKAASHGDAPAHCDAVERVAHFSVRTNVFLAGRAHGGRPSAWPLASQFLALGPRGWRRYLRDSRILDRTGARLRVLGRRLD